MGENSPHLNHTSPPVSSLKDFKAPSFKEDELVLYYHPYNFYSQKVCRHFKKNNNNNKYL